MTLVTRESFSLNRLIGYHPPSYPLALRVLAAILSALLSGLGVSLAQSPQPEMYDDDWRWICFKKEDGLPSDNVLNTIETTDGIEWAVTTKGLAWYDDYQWQRVDISEKLRGRVPTEVQPGYHDELIVLVDNLVYTGNKNGFRLLPLGRVVQAVPMSPDSLLILRGDTPYVYTHDRLDLFSSLMQLSKGQRSRILRSGKSGIWVVTSGGCYRWERHEWIQEISIPGNPPTISCFSENQNGSGLLYLGGKWQLWEWTRHSRPRENPGQSSAFAKAVAIADDDNALMVTDFAEPRIRIGNRWSTLMSSIRERHNITFLQFSDNGKLWVSTENGLYCYNQGLQRWKFLHHSYGDLGNLVNEIVRDKSGQIWLATAAGIDIVQPDETFKTIDRIDGKQLSAVTGMAVDNSGNLWVSSGSGFPGAYRWNGIRWDYFRISPDSVPIFVHKIQKDRGGRLWFLGLSPTTLYPGAYLLDGNRFIRWGQSEGLPSGGVYAFSEDSTGAYWFGTLVGLRKWTPHASATHTHAEEGNWSVPRGKDAGLKVFTLTVDKNNVVWFSDAASGLFYVGSDDSVRSLRAGDGLVNDKVWNIRGGTDGNLWIATKNGLSYYHDGFFSNFDQNNGLRIPFVWPLLVEQDRLLVGTLSGGLALLNLRETHDPPPKVSIPEPQRVGTVAYLTWRAYSYRGSQPPEEILTRYRIDEGMWSKWDHYNTPVTDTLLPGPHTLQVEAAGLFGDVAADAPLVSFDVALPFYRQPGFFIPIGGLAITVVILVISLVIRKQKHTAALRSSELKFRRLTEAALEGIAIHNRGIILDANQRILDMFGYPYDEFVGKSALEFMARESHNLVWEKMHSESESLYETVGMRKDGTKIFVEVIGKTIPYEDGVAHVIAVRDITSRKEAERRLLEYQSRLQSLASQLSMTEERERRRMAEFLHEYIVQSLALCKIKLEEPAAQGASDLSEKSLEEVRTLLDSMIRSTRSLTFELSPPVLYELDFEDALEWLTERMQDQHGMEIAFEAEDGPSPISADTRILLFHATRELLFNIVKHAHARRAGVMLHRRDGMVYIYVKDDGVGFEPGSVPNSLNGGGGFGLFNIRERLASTGGRMEIVSKPGSGTIVTLIAPLKEADETGLGGIL